MHWIGIEYYVDNPGRGQSVTKISLPVGQFEMGTNHDKSVEDALILSDLNSKHWEDILFRFVKYTYKYYLSDF